MQKIPFLEQSGCQKPADSSLDPVSHPPQISDGPDGSPLKSDKFDSPPLAMSGFMFFAKPHCLRQGSSLKIPLRARREGGISIRLDGKAHKYTDNSKRCQEKTNAGD
jgi:hypothetical protein